VPKADKLLESLEWFATILTGGYGVGDVVHDLTSEITDAIDLTGPGVTLAHDGKQRFVTAAVEAIAHLGRVQEDHQPGALRRRGDHVTADDGVGPGRRGHQPTLAGVRQRGQDTRDPRRSRHPDARRGSAVGAVNLYGTEPRGWPAEDLRVAAVFANIAAGYLVHASAAQQHQRITEQLQQALSTRVIIEEAKGVLATQRGIDVDEHSCFYAHMPATTAPASMTSPAPSSTANFTSLCARHRAVAPPGAGRR